MGVSRLTTRLSAIIILLSSAGAQFGQQGQGKKLYFLYDSENPRWCGYGSESDWRATAKQLRSLVLGFVQSAAGGIENVDLTAEDETGDSVVFDQYSFGSSGKLQSLRRTVNVIPGQLSVLETWLMKDGKPVKQSSVTRDLSTLKPVRPTDDWLPDAPIYTTLSELPFWQLISGRGQEISSKGMACAAEK